MNSTFSRREMLRQTGRGIVFGALGAQMCFAAQKPASSNANVGMVIGEEEGAKAGMQVLTDGGNAVDAAVAAALTACVATPARCGIGGYGGHMIISLEGGKKITAIDFNSTAPSTAHEDMYALDEKGAVKDRANFFGWLAAGVPGTLAGLQLALNLYGSRQFRDLAKPAIRFAMDGIEISAALATTIKSAANRFRNDPGSAKLYLRNNEPKQAGDVLRNPDLGRLLSTLAERNSVDTFYRGDIALRVAEAFQKNNGLVTFKDLSAYEAREVQPLRFQWNDFEIQTAPLTAGGLTVLQAFGMLKAMNWDSLPSSSSTAHARLEALRLAWKDRAELLGDPEKVKVPVDSLLSSERATEYATRIKDAVEAKKPIELHLNEHRDEGTNNLSVVDHHGNFVALTLTHGGSFGSQVTVDGLGLTLGHGMSRFTPQPGHPNAPGPGKRPLHNMCPSVVLREGKTVAAIGGAGGVHIPSGIFDVLINYLVRHASLDEALAAPRMHTSGTLEVGVEAAYPKMTQDYFKSLGFTLKPFEAARVSAVCAEGASGAFHGAMR